MSTMDKGWALMQISRFNLILIHKFLIQLTLIFKLQYYHNIEV